MKLKLLALAASLALLPMSGCKLVKTSAPVAADGTTSSDLDDVLIGTIVKESYGSKLLPLINSKAVDAATLLADIKADLNAAGKKSGNKGAGEGAPWAFAIKGKGNIVGEDRASRAGKAEVDLNGDGTPDITLQLGPVVKGTAMRDVANFYVFTEFRDQLQFAKLARALNDLTIGALKIPDGKLTGKSVSFIGVFSVNSPTGAVLVTPIVLEVGP